MADTGWVSPGTMADDDTVGTQAWTDPSNAGASDDNYAYAGVATTPALITHYLKATNFSFSIPEGATINGIEVGVEKMAWFPDAWNHAEDNIVSIIESDGNIGDTNKATAGDWGEDVDTYYSYGGSSDLWDESWSYSDINNSNFGLVFSASGESEDEFGIILYVDHIRIKVYYSEGTETDSERDIELTGADSDTSERDIEVTGSNTANSERGIETIGVDTDTSERDSETTGEDTDNDERDIELKGKLEVDSERNIELTGEVNDSYQKGYSDSLPSDDGNLTIYTDQEVSDVETDDGARVSKTGEASGYLIHQVKKVNTNNTDKINISWNGQATKAPSSSTVYLQIYNRNTPEWETVDSDNATAENTDFDLEVLKGDSLSDYYDENYVVSIRTYQQI